MDLVAELNNLDTKRNKFLFFKNASFDSRAIESRDSRFYRLLILLSYEIQGCLYGSEVLLFRHINFQRKPLFGNRKYNWGTLPRVREVFLNVAMYQERLGWSLITVLILDFSIILNKVFWAVA